jgi:beta-lactam-binding protein with PASTA domain
MSRVVAVLALMVLCACGRIEEPRMFTEDLRRVPDVLGSPVTDAVDDVESEGLVARVQRSAGAPLDPTDCPGAEVVRSDPPAGEKVVKATTVTLTVDPRTCPTQ